MKMFSLVVLSLMAVVAADYEPVELDYHDKIGMSLADNIKNQTLDPHSRISGGKPMKASERPYLVGILILLDNGRDSMCSGAMLSNTRSVTAAHCWRSKKYQAQQFTLAFGTANIYSGGTRVVSTTVQLSPSYNRMNLNNDFALITHDWVDYSKNIKAVSLPSAELLGDLFVGSWAFVTGFGEKGDDLEDDNNGQKYGVSVQVITNTVCAQTYGSSVIIQSSLCVSTAGARGTCYGDSGSPLTVANGGKDVLIGISSFESDNGCQKGLPAVFARFTSFVDWVKENSS